MTTVETVSPEALSPQTVAKIGAMKGIKAPQDAFDPKGAWKQAWRLYMIDQKADFRGMLTIDKSVQAGKDGFVLACDHRSIQHPQGLVHCIKAKVACRDDSLASPVEADIQGMVLGPTDDKPVKAMTIAKSWKLADGGIELTAAGKPRRAAIAQKFTGSFNLFDVVQRLPGKDAQPLEFDLLDEMDKPKAGHRLSFRQSTSISYAGADVETDCYQQLGSGQLPMIYYVDSRTRRLLLVLSGRRCYLLDHGADAFYQEEIKQYEARAQKWLT